MTREIQAPDDNRGARLLDDLKRRYEDQGFTFTMRPTADLLPAFLGSYRPDAIARKPGQNVAIEVKGPKTSPVETKIVDLRQKFIGQPDWRLNVVYANEEPPLSIPATTPVTVRERLEEVEALSDEGHSRAAFLLAWSLLEAALQALGDQAAHRPRSAGAVVQALGMNGYIRPEVEARLRGSVDLRNRLVHGDLSVEPSPGDVAFMLSAVREALTPEPV